MQLAIVGVTLWSTFTCGVGGSSPVHTAAPALVNMAVPRRMPYADSSERFQLKFAKGQSYFMEMTTKTTQNMKVMGQEVKQNQDQTFVWQVQPDGQTPEGDWLVRMRVVAARFTIDIGGNKIDYDSDAKAPAGAAAGLFDALLQSEFKAVIQPDGAVRKVLGRDDFLKRMDANAGGQRALVESILSEESLMRMMDPLGDFLPTRPVTPGEAWQRKRTLDLGPIGRYVTENTYRFESFKGSLAEIPFHSTFKYSAANVKKDGPLPFVIKSAETKRGEGEGRVVFDVERGRLHESVQTLRFAATLVIEVGQMETTIELDQVQSMRARVFDVLPKRDK